MFQAIISGNARAFDTEREAIAYVRGALDYYKAQTQDDAEAWSLSIMVDYWKDPFAELGTGIGPDGKLWGVVALTEADV